MIQTKSKLGLQHFAKQKKTKSKPNDDPRKPMMQKWDKHRVPTQPSAKWPAPFAILLNTKCFEEPSKGGLSQGEKWCLDRDPVKTASSNIIAWMTVSVDGCRLIYNVWDLFVSFL